MVLMVLRDALEMLRAIARIHCCLGRRFFDQVPKGIK
jgi:hypothetical protein